MNFPNRFNKYLLAVLLLFCIQACKQVLPKENTSIVNEAVKPIADAPLDSFDLKIKKLKEEYHLPGISFAFIKDGKLHSTRNYGKLQKSKQELINSETMFSVGSISKVGNALLILKLVEAGKLDLDVDINQYLKEWKVEDNQFTKNKAVTLRHILSHTAGFSVHGFADFLPDESLPNTLQILNGVAPAKNQKVELIFSVGSKFKYSGGGITVSQKIVEDVTGLPYHQAAQKFLIEPLGLKRTSYENPLPNSWNNVAKAHNESGDEVALPRGYQSMPETAASGLWTSTNDLTKILIAVYASLEKQADPFLSPNLATEMITKVPPSDFGIGPKIGSHQGDILMQHAGSNESYKAYFCFYFEKGFGYVGFTNGSNGRAFLMDNLEVFETQIRDIK